MDQGLSLSDVIVSIKLIWVRGILDVRDGDIVWLIPVLEHLLQEWHDVGFDFGIPDLVFGLDLSKVLVVGQCWGQDEDLNTHQSVSAQHR